MRRFEISRIIEKKIEGISKQTGISKTEIKRQVLVAGIRAFGDEDFLNPYPHTTNKLTKQKQVHSEINSSEEVA